ncbi:MAG: hypothetical protein AAGL23_07605 [Pseudomonadota bacterium]
MIMLRHARISPVGRGSPRRAPLRFQTALFSAVAVTLLGPSALSAASEPPNILIDTVQTCLNTSAEADIPTAETLENLGWVHPTSKAEQSTYWTLSLGFDASPSEVVRKENFFPGVAMTQSAEHALGVSWFREVEKEKDLFVCTIVTTSDFQVLETLSANGHRPKKIHDIGAGLVATFGDASLGILNQTASKPFLNLSAVAYFSKEN